MIAYAVQSQAPGLSSSPSVLYYDFNNEKWGQYVVLTFDRRAAMAAINQNGPEVQLVVIELCVTEDN